MIHKWVITVCPKIKNLQIVTTLQSKLRTFLSRAWFSFNIRDFSLTVSKLSDFIIFSLSKTIWIQIFGHNLPNRKTELDYNITKHHVLFLESGFIIFKASHQEIYQCEFQRILYIISSIWYGPYNMLLVHSNIWVISYLISIFLWNCAS